MDKLVDTVGRVNPTKNKVETSTVSNKKNTTYPEDTQEPQTTTNINGTSTTY